MYWWNAMPWLPCLFLIRFLVSNRPGLWEIVLWFFCKVFFTIIILNVVGLVRICCYFSRRWVRWRRRQTDNMFSISQLHLLSIIRIGPLYLACWMNPRQVYRISFDLIKSISSFFSFRILTRQETKYKLVWQVSFRVQWPQTFLLQSAQINPRAILSVLK